MEFLFLLFLFVPIFPFASFIICFLSGRISDWIWDRKFGTGFWTGFSDRISGPDISVRVFGPDFGPDFRPDFRTRFRTGFWTRFQTGFRTGYFGPDFGPDFWTRFSDWFSDRISDQIVLLSSGYCLVIIQLSKQCAPNFLFH